MLGGGGGGGLIPNNTTTTSTATDSGGSGGAPAGFTEEVERGGGGNRWPRQETLALLKIRSDMDVAFRDSTLKGPLWEEISRKMADHGYHRNPKKCKEKFENIFKYHKRTKGGRSSKPDGKTYRFFDQLEALENSTASPSPSSYQLPPPHSATMAVPMQVVHPIPTTQMGTHHQATATSAPQNFSNLMAQVTAATGTTAGDYFPGNSLSFLSNSTSSSSSTSSDEDMEQRRKRKRKWKELFDRLMRDVINKQEELQKSFFESLEKRERDKMAREESWRVQEMARIKREHDLLVQERSIAAARESAFIAFLQQMSNPQTPLNQNNSNKPPPPNVDTAATVVSVPQVEAPMQLLANAPQSQMQHQPPPPPPQTRGGEQTPKSDNGGGSESYMGAASSRWPKTEVEALIKLRTELDNKYQENGPKGPLWEEISQGMRKIGYNRNAKRCKEKWENINKYFKKVKESNKKRPEDSKTCPYFNQLDALYREKASVVKPESSMVPIMAQPENQWPLPQGGGAMEEHEGENVNDHEDDDEDGDDDDGEDEGSAYEIVTNKPSSSAQ